MFVGSGKEVSAGRTVLTDMVQCKHVRRGPTWRIKVTLSNKARPGGVLAGSRWSARRTRKDTFKPHVF